MRTYSKLDAGVRSYVTIGFTAIFFLIFGFGLWATQTELSGAVIIPAEVQTDLNHQNVQHATGGTVSDVFVREGDTVKKGEVLLRLDTNIAQAKLSDARAQVFDLTAQQNRLRAVYSNAFEVTFDHELILQSKKNQNLMSILEGQRLLFEANQASQEHQDKRFRLQKAQVVAQISGVAKQLDFLGNQIDLVNKAMLNQKSLLARGLSSSDDMLNLEREYSRLNSDRARLAAQRDEAEERIATIEVDFHQRIAQRREESIGLSRELEQALRQYRTEVQELTLRIAQSDIRAPSSGVVYLMQIHGESAVVRPAESILSLIPQDTPRIIVARVPPKQIAHVKLGQRVKLRFSSINQRPAPEIAGTVGYISADSIADDYTGSSFFRVEVEPVDEELADLGGDGILRPGMPVEALFQTGSWSPMRYLIKPVEDYFIQAFRER